MKVEFRSLHAEELDSWLDHCIFVFNKGVPSAGFRSYFRNHYVNDPWLKTEDILVAVEDGKILSTVRVFHRRIYMLGEEISMGGIGEVSTKPEYQRRGLSSQLLRLAVERMQERGFAVSWLSGILHDFYGKHGWQSVERRFVEAPLAASAVTVPNPNVRKVDFELDLPKLMELYASTASAWIGALVRSHPDYWSKWVRCEAQTKVMLAAPSPDGARLDGYIAATFHAEGLLVHEWIVRKGTDPVMVWDRLIEGLRLENGILPTNVKVAKPLADLLETRLTPFRESSDEATKYRLIRPFEAGGRRIETTEQLVTLMNQEGYVFWNMDAF